MTRPAVLSAVHRFVSGSPRVGLFAIECFGRTSDGDVCLVEPKSPLNANALPSAAQSSIDWRSSSMRTSLADEQILGLP
jgi:hypothetical protein